MNRSIFVVSFLSLALAAPIRYAQETGARGIGPVSTKCRSVVMVDCRANGDRVNVGGAGVDARSQLQDRRLGSDAWLLEEVVVEGARLKRPGVREILEENLRGPTSPGQFVTFDAGNGIRCTRALLLGYQECSRPANRVGKALDGPWR